MAAMGDLVLGFVGAGNMNGAILRGLLKKKNVSETEVLSRGLVVLFSEPVSPMAVAVLRHHAMRSRSFVLPS